MTTSTQPPELWGYQEMAAYFQVSVKTIQNRMCQGVLPKPLYIPGEATKKGRPMWLASQIAEYIEALALEQQQKPSTPNKKGRPTKARVVALRRGNV